MFGLAPVRVNPLEGHPPSHASRRGPPAIQAGVRRTARTGLASAVVSLSGSAISS
jgi:hypothetical protein